ncbi:MAG: hypothetical protein KKG99_08650, partial [Bacteroidetes bacterium]|nr:hypothetical protein [Bacteroidota bacterium]
AGFSSTQYILQGGFSGTPTADSRIAVPCPSDRNALRNPPRQHVPTVSGHSPFFRKKIISSANGWTQKKGNFGRQRLTD